MAKEEITKIIEENDDFKKDLMTEDYFDPGVIDYINYKTAVSKLGLLKLSTEEDASVFVKGCSGVINNERFTQLVGKNLVSVHFDTIIDRTSYFKIPGPYAKNTITEKINCNSNDEIEILRLNFVKVCVNKKEDATIVTSKVVGHVDSKDFVRLGKNHYVTLCKAIVDEPINTKPENFDILNKYPKTVIDINTELGIIRCGSYYDEGDEPEREVVSDDFWICIPLIVKRSMMKDIEDRVSSVFTNSISSIIETIINKENNSYSEDNLKELNEYLEKSLKSNPYVNKYNLIYDFENNNLIKLENVIEENSKELDYLKISDTIFPRYGSENINLEAYEKDENGLPLITEKDIANIHVLGVPKETIHEIIEYSKTSISTAKTTISADNEYLEKNKNEIYDSMCNLSLDINEKDWFESCKKNLEYIINETRSKTEISDSNDFINETCRKIAAFKLISERIQNKIDKGEFSNVYLSLSIDKMNSMSKKCLGEEAFNKNKCAFNNWLALINYFYNDNEFSKSAKERLSDCLQFSIINYDKKDKFGNYKPTIGESYSRLSSELINMDDIANDLSTEEEANELILRASAKFEFLKAISTQPFEIVSKLFPEISAAIRNVEVSEKDKETAEYFRKDLGYSNIDTPENKELVSKIIDKIKILNNNLTNEEIEKTVKLASVNGENIINKFNSSKMKGRKNKLECFCKLIAVMNNSSYITPIISGEIISEDRTNLDGKIIVSYEDGTEVSREVFEGLSAEDKEKYGIYTPINDAQKKELAMKYFINSALLSELFSVLYKFYNRYTEEFKESEKVDTDSMLTSILYLLVPSVTIIESIDMNKIPEDNFDILNFIDADKKVKLGNASIKNSMFGINSKSDLIDTKSSYTENALKYVFTAVSLFE